MYYIETITEKERKEVLKDFKDSQLKETYATFDTDDAYGGCVLKIKEDKEAKNIIEAKEKAFNENQDKQNQINQNTTNNSTITYNQNLYVSPNDLMEFFNQQANKNNQRVLDNQSFPEIAKEDDPLFLESTKEGGNDNE